MQGGLSTELQVIVTHRNHNFMKIDTQEGESRQNGKGIGSLRKRWWEAETKRRYNQQDDLYALVTDPLIVDKQLLDRKTDTLSSYLPYMYTMQKKMKRRQSV